MAEDRDHNLAGLSLEDKIALLSGASLWRTPALDSKGFRALKMSDGPHGVRGDGAVGGTRFPCGSVLGSTWDPDLLEALGAALGREARAKAVSILLGPTINLQRTLLGGVTLRLTARIRSSPRPWARPSFAGCRAKALPPAPSTS